MIDKLFESGRIEEIYGKDPQIISYQKERFGRIFKGIRGTLRKFR